jgi:hypothetical protein
MFVIINTLAYYKVNQKSVNAVSRNWTATIRNGSYFEVDAFQKSWLAKLKAKQTFLGQNHIPEYGSLNI